MAGARSSSSSSSLVIWLHGLSSSVSENDPLRAFFSSSRDFDRVRCSFPSAPPAPVSCYNGAIRHSWFDIHELPVSTKSLKDEDGVLKAVHNVHAVIDKEVATGTNPENIFVCGFSQGGALTLASAMLYPKTLGGGAIFSGWIPFNSSITEQISPEAKKTPILWCHGMADTDVLFEAGQAGPAFLEQAGVSCEFKAYSDLGHTISLEELHTLKSWIASRLKSSS